MNWIGRGHPRELNSVSQTACECSFVFLLDKKEPKQFSKWFEQNITIQAHWAYTYHKVLGTAVYFPLRKEEKHRQTNIV